MDESAEQFMAAVDAAQRCVRFGHDGGVALCRCSPKDFVASMRAQNKLIMGIGHVLVRWIDMPRRALLTRYCAV